jgi:pilus assembly protein CpaE
MSDAIKTLVAIEEESDRDLVTSALPPTGGIQIVGVVDGLDESWAVLQETATDLLVIACKGSSERALVLIDGAVKQRSDRPVVVLTESSPNGYIRRLFEAGADDILHLPESPINVEFALQKAIARRQGSAVGTGVALAPLICVLGPKGGTGKTVTSCNLAVSLAKAGHRVVIVDLDLQFGDVGLSLGIPPDRTIYDLAMSGGSLDAQKLDDYLGKHESGVRALLAPTRPDQAGTVTVGFLRDIYTLLRTMFDYVIVDTPPGFTPEVIASIDSSSHLCMVGMLDSLSLKNTKLGLETLELMGYDKSRISLVLNRAGSRVGIARDDVDTIVGRVPDVLIPSDREIPRSVNEGTPIVLAKGRSEASKAFDALARIYTTPVEEPAVSTNGRRSLLARKR